MPEPQPPERDAWLASVAHSLDLPPSMAGEVLEELGDHLDDASAGYLEAGLEPVDAERRAVRGFGDPSALGRDLGNARRHGRYLLAAVGGGIRSLVTFGIWAYLVLWLTAGVFALISVFVASTVLHALGGSTSSYFGGPLGRLGSVVISAAWFAWLGWVLPSRVAPLAHRSVRGVRRAVAIAGLVLGTWVVWVLVSTNLDPVLAVGLPLGPVVFALAAVRAGEDPSLLAGRRPVPVAILALMVLAVVVGAALATVTPSSHDGWEADMSVLGASPDAYPVVASTDYSMSWGPVGSSTSGEYTGGIGVGDPAQSAAFARQFPLLKLEIWPTTLRDGRLLFGAAPLAVGSARTDSLVADSQAEVQVAAPVYRTQVAITSVLIAVTPEGRRVVLGGPDGLYMTPAWNGTLLDWWFGSR